jgi:hypothetical protein
MMKKKWRRNIDKRNRNEKKVIGRSKRPRRLKVDSRG